MYYPLKGYNYLYIKSKLISTNKNENCDQIMIYTTMYKSFYQANLILNKSYDYNYFDQEWFKKL